MIGDASARVRNYVEDARNYLRLFPELFPEAERSEYGRRIDAVESRHDEAVQELDGAVARDFGTLKGWGERLEAIEQEAFNVHCDIQQDFYRRQEKLAVNRPSDQGGG